MSYRIRPADSTDLAACLDLWARKARTLAVAGIPESVLDQGRHTISSWIEDGIVQVVVTEAGAVVACLSPSDDDPGLRTPAELLLISERTGIGPEHRSDRLGPRARALREIAVTRDDLATAHALSADDDTFAVQADMLQRRLREQETRLTSLPDDAADRARATTD